MDLKYQDSLEFVAAQLTDSLGRTLFEYVFVCFGNLDREFIEAIEDENAKYFEVFLVSSLDGIVKKRNVTYLDWYLKTLRAMNLFRKCEADIVARGELSSNFLDTYTDEIYIDSYDEGGEFVPRNSHLEREYFCRLRFDVDEISSNEMFLVSNVVRMIQLHPRIVLDFYKLCNLHPEEDKFKLLIASHALYTNKKHAHHIYGYAITDFYFDYIVNSLEDAHEYIDTLETVRPFRDKVYFGDIRWDSFFVGTPDDTYRKELLEYSPERLKGLLSKENFKSYKTEQKLTKAKIKLGGW